MQVDLAGVEHWDSVYESRPINDIAWEPSDYGSIVIARVLLAEIARCKPASILEVGSGDSIWLPYLGRKTGIMVAGLDYSERGCELARRQLANAGVEGTVFCADLFETPTEEIGRYDFVYSLGMVEHFSDTAAVLGKLLKLVNPGGVLFTEVPNLKSIHGLMSWFWHPELLAKHKILGKRDLLKAYQKLGLEEIHGHHAGVFSLQIVAWDSYQRWPRLMKGFVPKIGRIQERLDYRLRHRGRYKGTAPLAPYIYVVGSVSRGER
jgi:2-polyprenyl-3-methyl-5-hydroxy-6-metoxy-1,4-benzoquinol methylase